jgi:fructosamine-3-kinase
VTIKLIDVSLRSSVEQFVSQHIGRKWSVSNAQDMAEFACHPAAILSDDNYSVFAKFSDAANGTEQFEIELAGLQMLSEHAGVLIPTPLGIIQVREGSVLVLEAVREVERGTRQWRDIGRALARIHKIKGERFGLDSNGYFGPLPQDNTAMSDWPTFYAERRLRPMLKLAVDSGHMTSSLTRQIEMVISRVPELCGPKVVPTLLHGDAQQNNFISTDKGAVVIDPAVYFGHPEMDLAYIDYFQPVPEDVFNGYHEELIIDSGFPERRALWRIWGYLAAVTVEGGGYVGMLAEAVQQYV